MRRIRGQRERRRPPRPPLSEFPPIIAPARKLLLEMDERELIAWLTTHQEELEAFCTYAQEWRISRNQRGIHTKNDDLYDRFLIQAVDLIAGLAEWRTNLESGYRDPEENQ